MTIEFLKSLKEKGKLTEEEYNVIEDVFAFEISLKAWKRGAEASYLEALKAKDVAENKLSQLSVN